MKATSIIKTKNPEGAKNQIFWQTSTDDQRPKIKILINNIEIKQMVDTGADVTIILPKFWPSDLPFQEVDIKFQKVRTSSQVKQSKKWLNYVRPEGQIGRVRSLVAYSAMK